MASIQILEQTAVPQSSLSLYSIFHVDSRNLTFRPRHIPPEPTL